MGIGLRNDLKIHFENIFIHFGPKLKVNCFFSVVSVLAPPKLKVALGASFTSVFEVFFDPGLS